MNGNDWLKKKLTEQRAREARQLEAARAEAERSGKEPFDFEKLCEKYDVTSPVTSSTEIREPEATARRYEYKYYCDWPEIRTLEAFVKCLQEMDLYR